MTDETATRASEPPQSGEAELQRAEQQISAILTIAADAIISLDDRFRITLFNEGAMAIFGYAQNEIIGQPLELLIPGRFHAQHVKHVAEFAASPSAARKMGERQEIFALRKDGSEFPAEASIAKREIGGAHIYMVVLRDVTERKRFEAELARANSELETRVAERTRELQSEIRRREETQAALIQSQRMEAFGQLTGGVAHDFNNLLTIVTGNLELLADGLHNDKSRMFLKRAADAADMGVGLTSRLLTFARRRRLSPQVLDLSELVLGLTELLKRSLGEPVSLTTVLAGSLWPVRADPSEIENALLNLAINARDAMPQGGSLIIETRNISAGSAEQKAEPMLGVGDFVLISVSDTGLGMTPEVLARAFEPFFTTKEPGRGTGLGLSTLHGFAEQSGGHAAISSEVGKGTTVSLYLPRTHDEAVPLVHDLSTEIPFSENCETILVVEDNPAVRELTLQRIEGLGYVVIEAENGPSAVRILERGEPVALVFSDIVMAGGMSGYDLARWAKLHVPGVKVLLTTGFAEEEAKADKDGSSIIEILRKPYNRAELAVALQTALKE
jgi:PAS domain S-box-containing protein